MPLYITPKKYITDNPKIKISMAITNTSNRWIDSILLSIFCLKIFFKIELANEEASKFIGLLNAKDNEYNPTSFALTQSAIRILSISALPVPITLDK